MTYKKKICLEKSMITSTSNQQMKNLMLLMKKAKARNEQKLFVVEGRKMFQEVPEEWLKQVYVSESFFAENDKMLAGYTYEIVSDSVFKAVSDTQTPQGILCLVRKPQYRLEELLKGADTHLLILESIKGMLEKDAYCPEILVQVSAVNAALNSFSRELLAQHIGSCVADDLRAGSDEKLEELLRLLPKLMK